MSLSVRWMSFFVVLMAAIVAMITPDEMWRDLWLVVRRVPWVYLWAVYDLLKELSAVTRWLGCKLRPRSCALDYVDLPEM